MKPLSYGYRDQPCHLPSRGTIAAKRACSTLAVCADKPARRIPVRIETSQAYSWRCLRPERPRARARALNSGVTLFGELQFVDDDCPALAGDGSTRSNNA